MFGGLQGWRKLVPFIWSHSREVRGWLLAAAIVGLIEVALTSASPILTSRIFDSFVRFDRDGFLKALLFAFTVSIAGVLATVAFSWFAINVEEQTACALRRKAFRGALDLSSSGLDAGDAMSRIANDTIGLKGVLGHAVLQPMLDVIRVIVYSVLLTRIDKPLTLLLFTCTPFSILMAHWMRPRIERLLGIARTSVGNFFGLGVGWLTAGEFVRESRLEEAAARFIDRGSRAVAKANLAGGWFSTTAGTLTTLVVAVSQLLVLAFGGLRVLDSRLSLGSLVAFQIFAALLGAPLQRLLQVASLDSASLLPLYYRIEPFFGFRGRGSVYRPVLGKVAGICLRDVEPEVRNARIFRLPDLRVATGSIVAVTGPNGVGKTTLLRALLDADDRENGSEVELDTGEAVDFRTAYAGGRLGYMAQKTFIAPGTLRDNLTLFDENPVPRAAERLCREMSLTALVERLPNGLDSNLIPADASLFSGGELRRVGLARALYRDPDVLFLDEPGAGLDLHGKEELRNLLRKRAESGNIVFIVTHEPDLVDICDWELTIARTPHQDCECLLQRRVEAAPCLFASVG